MYTDIGSMEVWWSYFSCQDSLNYPVAPEKLVHRLNGTVVFTKVEIQNTFTPEFERDFYAYNNNYHWFPVLSNEGKCDYKLGYLDGGSLNCPAFVPDAPNCADAACLNDI